MSSKKAAKKKQTNTNPISFPIKISTSEKMKYFWNEKKPVLLFVLGFGVLMGVFYAFWFSEIFKINILNPVVKLNAVVAVHVLNLFGLGTETNGSDIFSSAFTVDIKQGCDALEPIAIYSIAVALFPVPFRMKAIGLAVGVPLLWLLNQVRIISLFLAGIYSPFLFEIMHVQVWQAIFIAVTLLVLAYWIIWALRKGGVKRGQ